MIRANLQTSSFIAEETRCAVFVRVRLCICGSAHEREHPEIMSPCANNNNKAREDELTQNHPNNHKQKKKLTGE